MLDPEMPFLDLLFNVKVARGESGPEMRVPLIRETASMRPLGSGRFRLEGGLFDDATALYEDDRLYVHMMVARRVAWWESANAVLVSGGVVVLGLLSVPAVLVWRRARRRRATAPAP
jgi:hypothetical protein